MLSRICRPKRMAEGGAAEEPPALRLTSGRPMSSRRRDDEPSSAAVVHLPTIELPCEDAECGVVSPVGRRTADAELEANDFPRHALGPRPHQVKAGRNLLFIALPAVGHRSSAIGIRTSFRRYRGKVHGGLYPAISAGPAGCKPLFLSHSRSRASSAGALPSSEPEYRTTPTRRGGILASVTFGSDGTGAVSDVNSSVRTKTISRLPSLL